MLGWAPADQEAAERNEWISFLSVNFTILAENGYPSLENHRLVTGSSRREKEMDLTSFWTNDLNFTKSEGYGPSTASSRFNTEPHRISIKFYR